MVGLMFTTMAMCAQKDWSKDWFQNVKLSGYIIGEYQYNSQKDLTPHDNFSLRLVRMSVDGKVAKQFYFKVQAQLNGTPGSSSGPRIIDAFLEWQKYDFARIKIGEFKRAFTFENPMAPIAQGFMGYGSVISKLSGMEDRTGEHSSNGRDIGVQIQGDFLKNNAGRNLLHYQLAVYNGQGTNATDVDNKKDFIGGIWVMPINGLRLGAFGWTGSYARKGTVTDASGVSSQMIASVDRNRYAISGEYTADDWTFRSEYVHSQGKAFKNSSESDLTINESAGDKADGWYVAAIAPIKKDECHVKARYSTYSNDATWGNRNNQYELGVDYIFYKHVKAQLEYVRVNDRSSNNPNYNMIDCQVSVSF